MAELPLRRKEVYPFTVKNLLNVNFYESEQSCAKYRAYITKTNYLSSTYYYAIINHFLYEMETYLKRDTFSYQINDYSSIEEFTMELVNTDNPYTIEYEGESFTCNNTTYTINKNSTIKQA